MVWGRNRLLCFVVSAVPCPALPLLSARSQRRRQSGHSCQNSSLKERPHYVILPVPVVSAAALAPLCSPPLSSTALPKMRCPLQVRGVSSHRSDTSPRLLQPGLPLTLNLAILSTKFMLLDCDRSLMHLLRISWRTSIFGGMYKWETAPCVCPRTIGD